MAGTGGDLTVVENRGKNKKLVSSLLEGTGSNLTFTNPANTKSVYLASAPVSNKTFYYPNGRPELMINSGANLDLSSGGRAAS